MFLKKILRVNGLFSLASTSLIVIACGTNTGLELKVDLNDYVALTNIFANETESFDLNYKLDLIENEGNPGNTKIDQADEEAPPAVLQKQVIFDKDSNYLMNNCQYFNCIAKIFSGQEISNNLYNDLNNIPTGNNRHKVLENAQFSIDNLAKKINLIAFEKNNEIVYDFSDYILDLQTQNLRFYFNRYQDSDELYLYSNQSLKISNQEGEFSFSENYTIFDLKTVLKEDMFELYLNYTATIEVDETNEENFLSFHVEKSNYDIFKTNLNKLLFFANNYQTIDFKEVVTPPTSETFDEEVEPNKIMEGKLFNNIKIGDKLINKIKVEVINDDVIEE